MRKHRIIISSETNAFGQCIMYLKLRPIQKIKEGTLPSPSCKAKIFLISKTKAPQEKKTTEHISHKYKRKILNKILAN